MYSSKTGRKSRGPITLQHLQRASLIALVAGLSAKPALAELQITTATTTPVETTNTNGAGLDDDVTVTSTGSITINSGSAITLNSNNDVLNQGDLISTDDNDIVGIRIDGSGNYTGSVTNQDLISITEAYVATDTDGDGNLDGEWSQQSNNFGIRLTAGSFNGDITQSAAGAITVHGDNSAGIRLDGTLNGDLITAGAVTVRGDNSVGFDLNGPINGDVSISSNVTASGLNAMGIDLDGAVTGAFRIGGQVTATGFFSTARPSATAAANLDPDDQMNGGPAVSINASVTGGVEIAGIGVEDDDDDDGDGITEDTDTDDDVTASIRVFGGSPAVLVEAETGSITLGPHATWNYGFVNRGTISASGVQDGFAATGIRIAGSGANTVTVTNGLLQDGRINTTAYEAHSTGISIGAGATVPAIINRNQIAADSISEGAFNAYGVRVEAGGSVSTFTNNGSITSQLAGEVGDAYGVIDEAGTITSFTNTGSIVARVIATDSDLTDNVVPVAAGDAVAIDLSANTTGVTLTQSPDVVFTDQDTTDDDAASRPPVRILGDVRLGSGADTFNVLDGLVQGDIYFGGGADALFIDGGATVRGWLNDSAGGLAIDVADGTLELTGGGTVAMGAANGHLGADGRLIVHLSTTPAQSTLLQTTGAWDFDVGSVITPILPAGLPIDGSITFLQAGSLTGAANVTGAVDGANVPWVYNVAIVQTGSSLAVDYDLKNAVELGLDRNGAAAYDAIIAALRTSDTAAAGFAGIDTAAEFNQGFNDLMPNFASAAAEITATTIDQGQRASTNRLAAARLNGLQDSSIWLQEIAFVVNRDAESYGVDFDAGGFGVAAGIDAPLNNGAIFGLSLAFVGAETEAKDKTDNVASLTLGQANAYLGLGLGPVDIDAVIGAGIGRVSTSRDVSFGGYTASTEADYMTYEGHASLRASIPFELASWLVFRPYAEAVYVGMQEEGYEESGGGTAIDLEADDVFSQRLWGEAGAEITVPMRLFGTNVSPRLTLGYRGNLMDEETERTFRFRHAGATDFTLLDESMGDGGPVAGLAIQGGDEGTQISVGYEGEFGDTVDRHALLAAVRFRF